MAKVPENPCSITRSVSILGEKWTFLILRDAFDGLSRFEDFRESLRIAADVLSARLATLVDHGVMDKTEYREPGARRRYAYTLTSAGREVLPILAALQAWGDQHLPWSEGPSVRQRERGTGGTVHVGFINEEGAEVAVDEVLLDPTDSYPEQRLQLLRRRAGASM